MSLDFDAVKNLIEVSEKSDLSELIIEYEGVKIEIRRNRKSEGVIYSMPAKTSPEVTFVSPPLVSQEVKAPVDRTLEAREKISEEDSHYTKVLSPLVGVFYRSPWPGAKPFVEAGDTVSVGQTLCIVEAMKLMNEIPAEVSGKIVKILSENEEIVQCDEPLFLIDPD